MTEATASPKRTLVGRVVSNKMDKAVIVLVENRVKHPSYGRYMVCSKKYYTHDGANQYSEGDEVEITELRPLSRTKSWAISCPSEAACMI